MATASWAWFAMVVGAALQGVVGQTTQMGARFSVINATQGGAACFTTHGGACVTNGISALAGVAERCALSVTRGGALVTPVGFSTNRATTFTVGGTLAADGASVVGGTVFSGQTGPAGNVVSVGDTMWWTSVVISTPSQFQVCGAGWDVTSTFTTPYV
jgi:hypothetical protein